MWSWSILYSATTLNKFRHCFCLAFWTLQLHELFIALYIIQDRSNKGNVIVHLSKDDSSSISHKDKAFVMAFSFQSVLTLDCFLALLRRCFISKKKSNAPTTANPLTKLKSRRRNSLCPNNAGFVIAWSASYTTHINSIITQCSQATIITCRPQ